MRHRPRAGAVALAALCLATGCLASSAVWAHDESKYPAWEGKWGRDPGPPRYDPSKPDRHGQQPPLKPEYQAVFEASLADQAAGGQGNNFIHRCIPVGMPRQAASGFPIEIAITAKTTFILFESTFASTRRIHTDGRPWPETVELTFGGYSVGQWLDTDGDGRFDTLEVETRHMKGPRAVDNSGIPLHEDNATVVKERLFLDKANPNILNNEMTTFDNAFTHPWTVTKNYRRLKGELAEDNCNENNNHVEIGKEIYYLSADGYLMPAKRGQRPPDLRYFEKTQ
jgi:hypothetical protein